MQNVHPVLSSPLSDALEKAVIKDRHISMLGFPRRAVGFFCLVLFFLWCLAFSVERGIP